MTWTENTELNDTMKIIKTVNAVSKNHPRLRLRYATKLLRGRLSGLPSKLELYSGADSRSDPVLRFSDMQQSTMKSFRYNG
ncbi:predicted protein [Sclerotinia sclerotiorum 1980 UF-70]|uniref:Uncharacterized protein n=1 Tax=Sclerotinia sclerotiorum (strain ATCC 18683 / 1980 / Ss-1) TaxID=665079 RepID=A7E7K1_SCLS1|nr:predicted protein [Sclerotinia sclerotiorum 1980 UF-70]EDN96353.1 predicted protein [Sclerotinia sclerotiorum 1980 UF-70]